MVISLPVGMIFPFARHVSERGHGHPDWLRVENTHLGQGFRQTMPAWRFAQHKGRAVQFAWVIGFEPRNVQRNNPIEPTSFAVPDYPIEVHLLAAS
jgi:hypothetical protein